MANRACLVALGTSPSSAAWVGGAVDTGAAYALGFAEGGGTCRGVSCGSGGGDDAAFEGGAGGARPWELCAGLSAENSGAVSLAPPGDDGKDCCAGGK